jgi:hypothetical protein
VYIEVKSRRGRGVTVPHPNLSQVKRDEIRRKEKKGNEVPNAMKTRYAASEAAFGQQCKGMCGLLKG